MEEQNKKQIDELIARIKALVKEGNIARILIKHNDSTVLNLPLNAGIAGVALGIAAGPWTLIAAAVATLGLDCKIELIKKDGSAIELVSRNMAGKAANAGVSILERFTGGVSAEPAEEDFTVEDIPFVEDIPVREDPEAPAPEDGDQPL